MTNKDDTPEDKKLGNLIRSVYNPPEDLKVPSGFAARVRGHAEERAVGHSWWRSLGEVFSAPQAWAPALGAAAVLLVFLMMPRDESGMDQGQQQAIKTAAGTTASMDDPLGGDFFKFEGEVDESLVVELEEGWNAITVDDEESDSALVYFYSDEDPNSATNEVF